MLALPLAGLAWMFAWRSARAWAVLGGVAAGLMAVALQPAPVSAWLDARFGDWVWNQRGNYEMRGLPIHLAQEGVRSLARRGSAPQAADAFASTPTASALMRCARAASVSALSTAV